MVFTIPIIGLAANDFTPGNYIQIDFAQGPAASGSTNYSAILIGNMTTAGAAVADGYVYGPDTQTPLVTEQDCINLFGAGSELHRMWRRFTAVNQSTALYAIAVAESSGSKAMGQIQFTTTAAAPGTARVIIGDTVIDTGISTGDAVSTIATNVSIAINSNINLPVTSAPSGSNVVLTAKQKGLRGNFIKFSAKILPSAGVSTTVTPTARAVLSGGTTADSSTNALATISGTRYYYQVSAAEDSTQLAALVSQIGTNAQPVIGLRCRAVGGSVDTLANVTTLCTTLNSARAEIVWQPASDWTPAELASNAAAVYSLFEQSLGAQSSLNYDYFGSDPGTQPFWLVPAPIDGSTITRTSIKSALMNGITPISVSRPGVSTLVSRITTYSLTASQPDYRIRDSFKVTICDFYGDDLKSRAGLQFAGKVIGNDPASGQLPPGPTVVTPRVFLAMVNKLTNDYGNRDLLQNVSAIVASTVVIRESSPSTRLSARIPLQTIDALHQTGSDIVQVG